MLKVRKTIRIIRSPEAQCINGEWILVYRAKFKHMGRWYDVKRPQVVTTDSPTSQALWTEIRHVPAIFRSVAEAKEFCARMFNPPKDRVENWDVVGEYTL